MRHATPLMATALASLATNAHAESGAGLSGGLTLEVVFGEGGPKLGLGLDLRGGMAWADGMASDSHIDYNGAGLFLQGTFMGSAGARLAAGVYGGRATSDDVDAFAGLLEVGWVTRTGLGHGLHLGVLGSGLVEGHVRVGIFGDAVDWPIGLGVRYPNPIVWDGTWNPEREPVWVDECNQDGVCVGRPYRVGNQVAKPRVRLAAPRALREEARPWLVALADEAASVPAFEVLAWQLERLDAPATLLARARAAAREELRHTSACAQRASESLGTAVTVERLRPITRPIDFAGLVEEAWRDGVLNEGAAAAEARRSPDTIHRMIARDEAGHADLAWDTIRFALAHGGRPARDALAHARALTPPPTSLAAEEAHAQAHRLAQSV